MIIGAISVVLGLLAFIIVLHRTGSAEEQIDKISPLGNWTTVAIGLAEEKRDRDEGPLVILHGQDIRRMLRNLYRALAATNRYRVKAMHWAEPEEAEELELYMARLTQDIREAFGFLLLSPLEYVIRRVSRSESYFCSTGAALAYGNAFLMLEGIAEIVDTKTAEKIGRHLE
jgi:hypothetical protein